MATTELSRTAFTEIDGSGVKGLIQFRGGRVLMATTATPDAEDWTVCPDGFLVVTAETKYARAVDTGTVRAVWQAI